MSASEIAALERTFSKPRSTPSDWSSGVDAVFARYVEPKFWSISSTSVNVPPTSTPRR